MNSIYAKLSAVIEASRKHAAALPSVVDDPVAYRAWHGTMRDLQLVRTRVFDSVGWFDYGPDVARDVSRWSMTRAEWAGQE